MTVIRTAAACIALSLAAHAQAGFIIEIDIDGQDDGVLTFNPNFSFGGDTTIASQSSAGTYFGSTGGDSIFGGNGVSFVDQYVYTYSPDSQADNLNILAGQDLGEGNTATGVAGGGAGAYRVYAAWPFTNNVSGGPVTYSASTAGDAFSIDIDQNGGGAGRGDAWVFLGEIDYTGGAIVLTQEAGINSFISMRASAVLFEAVVPAPSSAGLLALAGLAAGRRRRA